MKKLVFLLLLIPSLAFAYTPPKGIPDPADSFSTFGAIDQATPAWPTEWTAETKSEVANKYYIDKTEAGCSDARTYGYPGYARCKPPEGNLAAGSYVYIHAGTYTGTDSGGDRFDWHGAGTASNPIWITGNATTKPIFTDKIHIALAGSASYIVMENLAVTGASVLIQPYNDAYDSDHIIVRNCTVTGTGTEGDSSGVLVGYAAVPDSYPNATATYTVIYNNTVSAFGGDADPGSDDCGIYQGYHTNSTWVLNNTIHDNGADGVAGSHYSDYTSLLANNYFIGGNTIYSNGENCIDVKTTDGVIISENDCSGPCAREQGGGIILHYGDNNLAVKNAWVIFNRVHEVSSGVGEGGSYGCDDCHFIGNLFYNIGTDYECAADATYNGYGIQLGGSHGALSVVDNTFYNCDRGVYVEDLAGTDSLKIHGNIFYRTKAGGYVLYENTDETKIDLNYNQIYYSGGAEAFYWGGASRTLDYMKGTASECANCAEGDPKFVSASNYTLQSDSPAIGANVEGPVGATAYDAFATAWSAYSLTIEKDYAGNSRPQGGTWDIGAYEYDPGAVYPAVSIGAGAGVSIGSGATMTLY